MTEFKMGDQIAYIPDHANEINHDDVEYGFVTGKSRVEGSYFCRYWIKGEPGRLRTTANSESTRSENLLHFETIPQEGIEKYLIDLGYNKEHE